MKAQRAIPLNYRIACTDKWLQSAYQLYTAPMIAPRTQVGHVKTNYLEVSSQIFNEYRMSIFQYVIGYSYAMSDLQLKHKLESD